MHVKLRNLHLLCDSAINNEDKINLNEKMLKFTQLRNC